MKKEVFKSKINFSNENEDDDLKIKGLALPFDQKPIDSRDFVFSKKSLQEWDGMTIPLKVDHSWDKVGDIIGSVKLILSKNGLEFEGIIYKECEDFKIFKRGLYDNVLGDVSIGLFVLEIQKKDNINTVEKIEIVELSLVFIGAMKNAKITEFFNLNKNLNLENISIFLKNNYNIDYNDFNNFVFKKDKVIEKKSKSLDLLLNCIKKINNKI